MTWRGLILYLSIIFFCMILILSSGFSVLKISNRRWLVGSSMSSAVLTVLFSVSFAVLVVAPNPIFLMIAGPASGVFLACLKWRTFWLRTLSSISFGSVIVWYSSLRPIVGMATSILERPPPLCFFSGSLENTALAICNFLRHLNTYLGHILGLLAIYVFLVLH